MEVPIGDQHYRIGKLDAVKQFHVARKLAPAVMALTNAATLLEGNIEDIKLEDFLSKKVGDLSKAFMPFADALASMSTADSEYLIKTCLGVVSRQEGDKWANVTAAGGQLMYADIGLKVMMQLVIEVIKENLGNFFPAGQQEESSSVA